ncbi:lipoyl(octanoyl) transferase LipB [Candidatus Woesearchaeota archaeon]|nr:lipoyl(octanoyl) transferase LipB [Candidatus Woesearchaeota archaeon]
MKCLVVDMGLVPYRDGLVIQEQLCALRSENKIEDTLLLLEHTPVITLGRKATSDMFRVSPIEVRNRGIDIVEIDRGGKITYHGPGQVVGYPILAFSRLGKSIDEYMTVLRQMLIAVLQEWSISSWQEDGGVWVAEGTKIGATGVAVKAFPSMQVTKHGFALDVNTNLTHFETIQPCGYVNGEAISMEKLLQKKVDISAVKQSIINLFGSAFGHSLEIIQKKELIQLISSSFPRRHPSLQPAGAQENTDNG